MAIQVLSSPPTRKHVWYPVGDRVSVGGRQEVLAHETTGSKVLLSLPGLERFEEDDEFAHMLGEWAVTCAQNPYTPREDNLSQFHSFINSSFPSRILSSSGRGYSGLGFSEATLRQPDSSTGTLIKAYDFIPSAGFNQFNTMLYIGGILGRTTDPAKRPKISTPEMYALMIQKRAPKATIFMQNITGSINMASWAIGQEYPPDGLSRDALTAYEIMKSLNKELKRRIGPFGARLTNDLELRNWLVDADPKDQENTTFYVIDQPNGKHIEMSRFLLPFGNIIRGIVTPKKSKPHKQKIH